jgi:AcrR family transcriptional regulator
MLDSTTDNLAQLEPEGLAAEGQGWQQRKSAQTRIAILEAAVDCLQRYGYAATTTQLISQTADISRGAMLHHYATKQDLIAAVIDYTLYKRMELFLGRIRRLSDSERVLDHAGIELYWESLLTREFTAFLELSNASRSDQELREVFLPKARRYDRVEREAVLQAFPEWKDKLELFELAMDFCIAGMEGILRNRETWDDRARRARLRAFISHVILLLRDGALSVDGTVVPLEATKKPKRGRGK